MDYRIERPGLPDGHRPPEASRAHAGRAEVRQPGPPARNMLTVEGEIGLIGDVVQDITNGSVSKERKKGAIALYLMFTWPITSLAVLLVCMLLAKLWNFASSAL